MNMNKFRVGKQIQNQNGKVYTVLACKDDRALLVGGWDYVVINNLSYFEKTGSWSEGRYFPFFVDEDSAKMLDVAFYYFNNYEYGQYTVRETDEEDDD